MTRVVITGMGIVSSIGNDVDSVQDALWQGRSGISFNEKFQEVGMRSHVSGSLDFDAKQFVPKKMLRFMGVAGSYAYSAAEQAIQNSGLEQSVLSSGRTGMIVGTGGVSYDEAIEAVGILKDRGIRKVGPYRVTRGMASSVTACLATAFAIKGVSYAVSSACASGSHAIGVASEQIKLGKQDVMIAGGADDPDWTMAVQFDAMGALSTKFNDKPSQASRPYDEQRDGFVISGGAGILVLESLEHAQKRGATILAELVGYGASSDGDGMVKPSGEGAVRCMQMAVQEHSVDYVNAHGTSTPVGDVVELQAIHDAFAGSDSNSLPKVSSTKSITGHGLGAAGAQEAIYSLLMLRNGFIAGSQNIDVMEASPLTQSICRQSEKADLQCVMSNSFGFGGTNASLVFKNNIEL